MPSLATLPTELIVEIAENLSGDLKSFSCTNHRLRHAASHILFRTLNIACPLVSDMLLAHMLIKYRHAISRIHLHIRLRPNLPEDDIDECDINEMPSIWGTERSNTLLQLVRGEIFSHIDSFSVHFDPSHFDLEGCWFGDGGTWGGGGGESLSVFQDYEDDEAWEGDEGPNGEGMMLNFERLYIWRAQYNQVFKALVMNPNITKLRFVDLLPKRASIWYSDGWVSMLETHTFRRRYLRSRKWFIACYLTNVKHLRLEASPLSVFGVDTYITGWHNPFPLHGPASALHSLELKNVVLGEDFMDYLKQQGGTLRELTLHNCMCYSCKLGPEPQWSHIWDTVSEYCKVPQRLDFLQDEEPPLGSFRIAKKKDVIVWRYADIDPERGTVLEDGDANVEEVITGCAFQKYCDLQKMLEERRETSADD